MRVAICYSGMFRGFDKNINNHIVHLINKYNSDIYINLWDIKGYGEVSVKLDTYADHSSIDEHDIKKQLIFNNRTITVDENEINKISSKIKIKKYRIDSYYEFESQAEEMHQRYNKHSGQPYIKNIYSMFYSINRCNSLIDLDEKYDIILRLRTDLVFFLPIELTFPSTNTLYYNSLGSWSGAINDTILYGNYQTMNKISQIFFSLPDLWTTFPSYTSPEILLSYFASNNNIKTQSHAYEYKLKRVDRVE